MSKLQPTFAITLALVAMIGLAGCGKNPSAASAPEGKINGKIAKPASALIAKVPTAKAATSSKTATAKATTPAAKATTATIKTPSGSETIKAEPKAVDAKTPALPKEVVPATVKTPAAALDGSMKLGIKLTGDAPVTGLGLKVFDQVDPSKSFEAPLKLANGVATWEQGDLPAGKYTVQVKALDNSGKLLGLGSTEAVIKGGQLSDVALDLRVNMAAPADETKATIASEETPAAQGGGTLGLNIEVL